MQTKILLDEEQMPKKWYNVQADLKSPLDPPLHPKTQKPIGPEDLAAIFPMELIRQEVTTDRHIDIPGEVQDVLRLWRPSPLYRAHRLEKFLKTPARIYYKWEGVSPAGSHKPNTSIPQAYYNMKAGVERIATETGAGQWGSALAFATMLYDLRVHDLYGPVKLHAETVPEIHDACLGSRMHSQSEHQNKCRSCNA